VTANSIATLNALAPGRTFLGIGTANNALRSMGNRPAKLSELDSALTIARGLLAGERVTQTWLGQERDIEFLDKNGHWYNIDAPVDVWMSAGGPKGFALAAKHADYMTYCLGPNPEMIGVVRRELDKAVAEAGRPPGSVKLVALSWFYQLRNGETWEDGVDHGFGSGPISSCITNAGFMNDHVDELGERIVTASTNAAKAYLGDPTAPDAPHYLEVWAKYLRDSTPSTGR
jgi:alkanesulfonate monooxygenase SsuD/methylene tetrahydromethanopterin reductase-like flavin-dependent oxidoreductase (luciferase family)